MSEAEVNREGIAAFLLRMRSRGISDKRLLKAIESVPRESFIPGQWQPAAYADRMIPIACGEAIESIDLQTFVLSRLDVGEGQRVLEIGTGSGFTAAVMGRLGGRVTTIDRYRTLCNDAMQRFGDLELGNVITKHADGSAGLPGRGRSTGSSPGRRSRACRALMSSFCRAAAS